MAPRETENNAYAKFRGDEQRTLWYVMVFSGAVNCAILLISAFISLIAYHMVSTALFKLA